MTDPVVLALEAAITARDSVELRVAAGERLLALGSGAQALLHFEAALRLQAGDPEALRGAAAAAAAAGDAPKAAAYALALGEPRPEEGSGGDGSEDGRGGGDGAVEAPPSRPLRLVQAGPEAGLEEPSIGFSEVGGMDAAKQRLTRSFLTPLRNPELLRKFGKTIGGGLVLYGPPGCGKTFLARALAGEIGARFVNVGLSDVLDMWFGESERKLHELFENARRRQPTVLFFDELDALGQRRAQLKGSAGRNLVNQLLTEMDGFAGKNEGVFFLGATNHPWDIDPALRRPGRFDRLVFVPPPDADARLAILRLKLAGKPVSPKLDEQRLVRATDGFSGADLDALVGAAAELAIEASLGRGKDVALDDALFAKALREARSSTRPWFEVARNHAVYANEGGTYDELLDHLRTSGLA